LLKKEKGIFLFLQYFEIVTFIPHVLLDAN
jgi:hypothetical protein